MYRTRNTESFILLIGDIISLVVALPLALLIRHLSVPSLRLLANHVVPFLVVHLLWIVGFYMFDMYSQQTVAFRRRIVSVISRAQLFNFVVGIVVFYLATTVVISPKTTLVIDALVATLLIGIWRVYVVPRMYSSRPTVAVAIGEGYEFDSLLNEITHNPKFNFNVVGRTQEDIATQGPEVVILDPRDASLSQEVLSSYVTKGGRVLDAQTLYEDIFDRIPLSLIGEAWFFANITGRSHRVYDILKRTMDIVIGGLVFLFTLVLYPALAILIKLEDRGVVFYGQNRVGQHGRLVRMYKFRSMNVADSGDSVLKSKGAVTHIGKIMRKSRMDELPQLLNVLRGDISLVGPRLEFPALADVYRREIAFYDIRHIIKPGLSGWAQIYHREHPHHEEAVEETRAKLSYDLYYVKNRSFTLDLKIALKTIKTVLFFEGA
ncbi:MAG: sugar transferase [bacterium]|nr:sugar transferase [bacterium]